MDQLDCVVIGAGVVGIAVARALALEGREVCLLEETERIGNHASSRNSEVIHAGIYYRPGSLKAELCVKGRELLYRYCEERGIRHRRIGKLIVAADEGEIPKLHRLARQARDNGVADLVLLDRREFERLEPALRGEVALLSPSTGILDSHGLMESLLADAKDRGAFVVFGSPVTGGRVAAGWIELAVGGSDPMAVRCRTVVNCAGFMAPQVARSIAGCPHNSVPRSFLCKGNYFSTSAKVPFTRLIYPAPDQAGLGIHLTMDLAGKARFGPDTEWVDEVDYSVDERRSEAFYAAIRRYWPGFPDGSLTPDYSGIRAKISGPGEEAADFMIAGPRDHGVDGLVHLFGIESPGLTASMAIAERVKTLLDGARPEAGQGI